MQSLIDLYRATFGREPKHVDPIAKAGSNRRYYRLHGAPDAVGVVGTSPDENRCFINLSRHFAASQLPVPQILAVSTDERCYLQEDLGTCSLFDALRNGRAAGGHYDEEAERLLEQTIRCLPHFQLEGSKNLDASKLLPPALFTARTALYDFNYFKYCFLRTTDVAFDEEALQEDFEAFARDLATTEERGFLYRDFQARNVMLRKGKPYFIDYQGGKLGPLHYDVASFLWQASAKYPQELRERLITAYLDELCILTDGIDHAKFRTTLQRFVLFRVLQVLGAYGLRGRFERKKHFLDSIPPALENLRTLLAEGVCTPYPYLESVLRNLVEAETSAQQPAKCESSDGGPLVVRIFSFSYKRGIPEDESGNGGGYVFDCRSTHNPGRYEPYKQLTGLDAPVIKFLEDDGEILTFLESVYELADRHVERYLQRGFTALMFSFGCTGGQHRSVYSAEHLAEHLHNKYGIEVRLTHREQNISRVLERSRA